MFASRFANATRGFVTTAVKRGGHGGVPGENLPFSIGNPTKLTLMFIGFFSVPFAAPFLIVRYQMLKQN